MSTIIMVESHSHSTPFQLYWDLCKPDIDIRNNAVYKLYNTLADAQQQYELNDNATDTSDIDDSELIDPSIQYSIKRLINGLQSSRLAARQGFAAALTLLLTKYNNTIISTQYILSVIPCRQVSDKSLPSGGGMNKQEQKDYYMSKIFIWQILCQTNRINDCTNDIIYNGINELIDVALNKSSALNEIIYHTIYSIISQLLMNMSWEQYTATELYTLINVTILSQPLNKLNVYQCMHALQLVELYNTRNLSEQRITADSSIINVLQFNDESVTKQLIESLYTHCIQQQQKLLPKTYLYIMQRILNNNHSNHKYNQFAQFWHHVVSAQCLTQESSSVHKSIGLNIVLQLIQYLIELSIDKSNTILYTQIVQILLDNNLITCTIYNLAASTQAFHPLCVHIITQLLQLCSTHRPLTLPVIQSITSIEPQFDSMSHTSTLQQLMASLDQPQVMQHIATLQSQFQHNQHSVIQSLYTLLKCVYNTLTHDNKYIMAIINYLILYGYTKQDDVDTKTQILCQSRLHSILNDILQSKLYSNATDYLLHTVKQLNAASSKHTLLVVLDDTTLSVNKDTLKLIKSIDKKLSSTADDVLLSQITSLKALILYMLYQSYTKPDVIESIHELHTIYNQLIDTTIESAEYIHIFVDLLIQLLSSSTDMLRYIIRHTVTVYADMLNELCMKTILSVLNDNDAVNDDSDDDMQPLDESEIAVHDGNSESNNSSDDSDIDTDIPLNGVVLNNDGMANSDNELTVDFNSIGNILLDTDNTDQYSTALNTVVQLHHDKRGGTKQLTEQTIHFKYRIIELIELLMKCGTLNSSLKLSCIPQLIHCMNTMKSQRSNKLLLQRLITVYTKLCRSNKHAPVIDNITVTYTQCTDIMTQLSELLVQSDSELIPLINQGILYMIRIMCNYNTNDTIEYMSNQYTIWLQQYITTNNTHIQPQLFTELAQRYPQIAIHLISCILDYTIQINTNQFKLSLFTYNTLYTILYNIVQHSKHVLFTCGTIDINVICNKSAHTLINCIQHTNKQINEFNTNESPSTTQLQSICKRLYNTLKYINLLLQYCIKYNTDNKHLIHHIVTTDVIKLISSMSTQLTDNASIKQQLHQLSQHTTIQFNSLLPTDDLTDTHTTVQPSSQLPTVGKKRRLDPVIIEKIKQRQKLHSII